MPKASPLRRGGLSLLPPRLLNALFPAVRLASQLLALLCFHAFVPFRHAFRRREPPALATGAVAAVCATWAGGVPKPQRRAAFVSRLGVLGDTQRSDWIASWGGHGGVDKAGAPLELWGHAPLRTAPRLTPRPRAQSASSTPTTWRRWRRRGTR